MGGGYGGFLCDVISSQFSSHHTRYCYVGFLLAWHGIGNTTKYLRTFYLAHITILNYNRVTRIKAHTLGGNFKSFSEVFFFQAFFVKKTKRKSSGLARSCVYRSVLRRANPLFRFLPTTHAESNAKHSASPICARSAAFHAYLSSRPDHSRIK